MRLVCPNCDAEYEVDDTAIPLAGRDVQCSNCGHGWFQAHPEVEADDDDFVPPAAMAEASVVEAVEAVSPAAKTAEAVAAQVMTDKAVKAETVTAETVSGDSMSAEGTAGDAAAPIKAEPGVPELAVAHDAVLAGPGLDQAVPSAESAVAATLKAAAMGADGPVGRPSALPIPSRALDDSVMAVLREEAALEVAARKAEVAPVIETQTEMGLAPEATGLATAAIKRLARLKGTPEPEAPVVPKSRREMLPAIEEINSTLRATNDRRSNDDAVVDTMAEDKPAKAGFGRGFMTLVLLAVILVALYLLAPLIGAKVPALAGAAKDYVALVDAGRVWLDTEIKSLVAKLRGMQGTSGG